MAEGMRLHSFLSVHIFLVFYCDQNTTAGYIYLLILPVSCPCCLLISFNTVDVVLNTSDTDDSCCNLSRDQLRMQTSCAHTATYCFFLGPTPHPSQGLSSFSLSCKHTSPSVHPFCLCIMKLQLLPFNCLRN